MFAPPSARPNFFKCAPPPSLESWIRPWFDTRILPIITYGCEIWGYENNKQLEKLHLQYCRNILGVRTTTPNFMTYGELGRTPIDICIKLRIVNFWNRLISNEEKLSCILYKIMFNLSIIDNVQFKWRNFIK